MSDRKPSGPSELVYPPRPSWAPAFLATGLALALVGAFAGWVYSALGAIIALSALWSWIRAEAREISRLPRTQTVTSAVIPPVPVRRSARSD